MKMTFGRKFWGCIAGLVLLTYVLVFLTLKNPDPITEKVVLAYMILVVVLVITYIGGNVLNKWVATIRDIKPEIKLGK